MKSYKYIIILSILIIIDCSIGGYINVWREWYWSALSNKEFTKWVWLIGQFSILALVSCAVSGYLQYIGNMLSLNIRDKLTEKSLSLETYKNIEGGSQRVQEDCRDYPTLVISLVVGLIRALIMSIVCVFIILSHLSGLYLLFPIVYTIIGTLIAGKIAFPLINLNYINQVFEAKFRQLLTDLNYKDVHNNNYQLFKYSKYLQYFQSFYNQITVIVPHLILSIVYFSGKITFGIFMQLASAMAEIINNLSFIINSFNEFNRLLSCRKRLKEIKVI